MGHTDDLAHVALLLPEIHVSIVLDYTERIAPSAIKAAGASGVCRYLSWASASWKVIDKYEYAELDISGIDIYLNWEYAATDWLGGYAKGIAHGREAARQASALNYPRSRPIIGSCDFDMTRSQWESSGRDYATGFMTGLAESGYNSGVYGPWDVLQWCHDEGLMSFYWQAGMSTSWSGGRNAQAWPHMNLRQRGHKTVGGIDTDWNEIGEPYMTEPYPKGTIPGYPDNTGASVLSTLMTRTNYLANTAGLVQKLLDLGSKADSIIAGQAAILAAAQDDGNVSVTLDPASLTQLGDIHTELAKLRAQLADAAKKASESLADLS